MEVNNKIVKPKAMYKNILILGAETSFGIHLTNYLLSLNYFVTILVKEKKLIKIENFNLEIIKGDILDYESLKFAVDGQQVVMNVTDFRDFKTGEISVISQNIVHAINANYVDKYVGLAPIGSGKTRDKLSIISKIVNYLKFINPKLNEYTFQESLLSKSAIDFTIVQVGEITNTQNNNGIFEITKPLKIKHFINKNKLNISENKLCDALHNIMIQKEYEKSSVVLMNRMI